jgi:hypothetical protein
LQWALQRLSHCFSRRSELGYTFAVIFRLLSESGADLAGAVTGGGLLRLGVNFKLAAYEMHKPPAVIAQTFGLSR